MNMEWAQARVVNTPLVDRLLGGQSNADFASAGANMEPAWVDGDLDASFIPAGQIMGMIKGIKSVGEIIEEMVG